MKHASKRSKRQSFGKVSIVGVLNVTPDSFFDGGKFTTTEAAVKRAEELLTDGADIIEIGGESTGPNSPEVSLDEELNRTIPIIQAIRKKFPEAVLAIDTYKAPVAEAAMNEGVCIVNDVTSGRSDPNILKVVAKNPTVKIVLMYAKDPTPRTAVANKEYDNVIETVKNFLQEQKNAAMGAGIVESSIILDPGLGHFVSSDPQYSFQILAKLEEFTKLGSPIFVSPSRKSFLAGSENLKTADRLPGTIAASAIAALHGAAYIRTHDVLQVRRAIEIATAIKES